MPAPVQTVNPILLSLRFVLVVFIQVGMWVLYGLDVVTNFSFATFERYTKAVLAGFLLAFLAIIPVYESRTHSLSVLFEELFIPQYSVTAKIMLVQKEHAPILIKNLYVGALTAKEALVVDATYNKKLYEFNAGNIAAPASTTKLLTAITALDLYSLDAQLAVPEECTKVESMRAYFTKNLLFKVSDLIKAMLISSAGDAACVLASGISSQAGFADDTDTFVAMMNQKAEEIGMKNSYFTNPIGLDAVDGRNVSTAYDLYILTKEALKYDLVKEAVRTTDIELKSSDARYYTRLYNTNKLLWEIPETVGVKTGTTAGAGEVLIYEYRDDLRDLIIVVMGSSDRFADTRALLNWSLQSYKWD